jgi:hypothetical protein
MAIGGRAVAVLVTVVTCVAAGGWFFAAETQRADAASLALAHYVRATSTYVSGRTQAGETIASMTAAIASAQNLLDGSAGLVLTEKPRALLAAEIRNAADQIDAATVEVAQADAFLTSVSPDNREKTAATLDRTHFTVTAQLGSFGARLATASDAVRTGMAALQDKNAKSAAKAVAVTAAKNAAAAHAAAELATAHAVALRTPDVALAIVAPPAPHAFRPDPTTSRGPFTLNVWAAGGQKEVDACKGGVDATSVYRVAVIAEHWFCGGSLFPQKLGTTVTLTGLDAGVYRVGGVVKLLDHATAHTVDVPGGYDLLFQTCQNNSDKTMSFTALTRIG